MHHHIAQLPGCKMVQTVRVAFSIPWCGHQHVTDETVIHLKKEPRPRVDMSREDDVVPMQVFGVYGIVCEYGPCMDNGHAADFRKVACGQFYH